MPYESIAIAQRVILDPTGAIVISKVYDLDGHVYAAQKFYSHIPADALENLRLSGVTIVDRRVPVHPLEK